MSGIIISREGSAQVLRFDRVAKKNALTGEMYTALADALERGDADDTVACHVILGQDGVFTAGNDISEFAASAMGDGATLKAVLRYIQLLPRVKKPMVAGVQGLAVGIGTTLLLHCDIVLASEDAQFRTPFLDLGLVPEAGSSLLVPARMGYQRAFEMLVLGAPFSAERMREAGLVNAIVPAADLEARVMGIAQALAAKPPKALAEARRLMRGNVEELATVVDEEARVFSALLRSPEAREAFQAFFEKRRPDFAKFRGS